MSERKKMNQKFNKDDQKDYKKKNRKASEPGKFSDKKNQKGKFKKVFSKEDKSMGKLAHRSKESTYPSKGGKFKDEKVLSVFDKVFVDPDKIRRKKEQDELIGPMETRVFSKSIDDIENEKY